MEKVMLTIVAALVSITFAGSLLATDAEKNIVTTADTQSIDTAKRDGNKIGKLVAVQMTVGRDFTTGRLVPEKSLNASGEGEVVVELSDGMTVNARCNTSLLFRLKGGEKLEIKPGKEANDWIVVRVVE
jgi:hypothetical protein